MNSEVMKYYSDKEVIKHLEIAEEIATNPSVVHGGKRHENAIKADEFDWNVFAKRIVHLKELEWKKKDPLQKCRLAIGLLNADLSYDNKNKARQLLHEIVELVTEMQAEQRKNREDEKVDIEEMRKHFLIQYAELKAELNKHKNTPKDRPCRTLDKEKERYRQLQRELCI